MLLAWNHARAMSRTEPYLELTISPWPPADDSIVDLLRREIDRLVNIGHVRVEPLDGRLLLSTTALRSRQKWEAATVCGVWRPTCA